jgi:hypothetical protein
MSASQSPAPYGYDPETGRPIDPDEDLRRRARERVEAKSSFRTNLFAWIVVNAMLVVFWFIGDTGFFWPIFPMLGWGIGLLFHWRSAYGDPGVTESRIQAEMDRLRNS